MSDDGPRIFGSYANEHSRFRPGYPSALWDWGIPEDATVVVDLGCGSGHASLALAERDLVVVGVEKDSKLREEASLQASRAGVELDLVPGSADATGLPDCFADLVITGDLIHWKNLGEVLPEIHRILQPGGNLLLFWNDRDPEGHPWLGKFEALVAFHAGEEGSRKKDFEPDVDLLVGGYFYDFEHQAFIQELPMSSEEFVGYARTLSAVRSALDAQGLLEFEKALRRMLEEHHGSGMLTLPLRTEGWRASRRG